jgi:hypothetical protein
MDGKTTLVLPHGPTETYLLRKMGYDIPSPINSHYDYRGGKPFDVQRKEQFQLIARNAPGTTGLVIMNEGMWGSPGFFYLGKNIPWCPCDFPHDQCFQIAARDARFNRGLFWLNSTSEAEAERGRQAEAAFVAAGFKVAERRGLATYFVRGE